MKTCAKCKIEKDGDEFSKALAERDGLQWYCKACAKIARNTHYAANADQEKAAAAVYRAANPEKEKIYTANAKAKYAANPEVRARRKASRSANKERNKISGAKWRKANPDSHRISNHNRRVKARAEGGKLSKGLRTRLFALQQGKCPCCGQPLGKDAHLDHIQPISLGGSNADENMQLLTAFCNLSKGAKNPVDFMQSRGFLL